MAHSDHGEFREEFHDNHPHSYDHQEPKYSALWLVLGGTVVFLILSTVAIQAYVEGLWVRQTYDKVLSQDNHQLQELRKTEEQELMNYGVAEAGTQTMRLPIQEAMRQVLADAAAGTPKYPTAPYALKSEEELAATTPGVSQAGASAMQGTQNQGVVSDPNARDSMVRQQPAR